MYYLYLHRNWMLIKKPALVVWPDPDKYFDYPRNPNVLRRWEINNEEDADQALIEAVRITQEKGILLLLT